MTPSVLLVFHSSADRRLSIDRLPPLGILSIASFLQHRRVRCTVLDLSINSSSHIDPQPYDIIGFSINISNRESSFEAIARIRREAPNKQIVVGGPLCISNPEYFFRKDLIDAVFVGEGEEALFEYATTPSRDAVKGIYLRKGPDFVFAGEREWIQDLDELPFPALQQVDLRKYDSFPKRRRPISSIMTSRGCPFSCIFCSHSMGRKWRPRSASKVVDEIRWQVNDLGVREICVFDDNFSLDRERAQEICDRLIEARLPVTLQFTNGLRADCVDRALLAKLKEAGTWMVGLAPETGNPGVMRKIRKGFDHSEVMSVRKDCRKLGITTFGFFMIGFPFESRREIEDTITFAKALDCDMVEFNKVIPYAKTELYDTLKSQGSLIDEGSLETRSYHEGTITTHRVGDLDQDEVKALIRRAYRQYYLRPETMINLLTTFTLRDLWTLTKFAVSTRNV